MLIIRCVECVVSCFVLGWFGAVKRDVYLLWDIVIDGVEYY